VEGTTGKSMGLKAVRGTILIVSELAKFMRVSERWIYSHMDDGTFPIRWFLFGERNRGVDSADFDEWLYKIVVEAGTAPLPLRAVKKIQERRLTAN